MNPGTAALAQPQADGTKPVTMPQKWIAALLPQLAHGDREYAKRILKGCAQSHYEHLNMRETVDRFRGNVDEFLAFLRKEWGWIIEYDRDQGIIQVDENKSSCVCPLIHGDLGSDLGILCYCSEGFAERLFSEVFRFPVQAEVVGSILRGNKSCKYRINLRPPNT